MASLNNRNWEGYASLACFFLLALVPAFASIEGEFGNIASWIVLLLAGSFGLLFGISGLRTGSWLGRICSVIALLLFTGAIFFRYSPLVKTLVNMTTTTPPNEEIGCKFSREVIRCIDSFFIGRIA